MQSCTSQIRGTIVVKQLRKHAPHVSISEAEVMLVDHFQRVLASLDALKVDGRFGKGWKRWQDTLPVDDLLATSFGF